MAENSKIEWTHHTFNPWIGCVKVSDGCKHCYAEADMDKRRKRVTWGPLPKGTRILTSDSYWRQPFKWDREAEAAGERRRVFCASLADVFEDWPGPIRLGSTEWIGAELYVEGPGVWSTGGGVLASRDRREQLQKVTMQDVRTVLFEMIERTKHLDWLLLTKRPENILRMVPSAWRDGFPPNVWLGTSCEDQKTADERIPHLLGCPATVRFLSCEPLLGPIDLINQKWEVPGLAPGQNPKLHWVIAGGESGHGARPMHPDWVRSLRDQCQAASVAFFFKQWGAYVTEDQSPQDIVLPSSCTCFWADSLGRGDQTCCYKVGKHAAGRELDGCTWDEMPEVPLG